MGSAQLVERRTLGGLCLSLGRDLDRGVLDGVLNVVFRRVGLERDRVDQSHAGWGSDTARSASRERGGAPSVTGVLTWRSLAPRCGTRDLHGCAHARTNRPGG